MPAKAGVGEIWVDPGIGFGKTVEHNLALLANVGQLVGDAEERGARVLVGTSNKWFLGVIGSPTGVPLPSASGLRDRWRRAPGR